MEFNCEMLGISQEEMQDRVINAAAEKLLSSSKIMSYDDDDSGEVSTPFAKAMQEFLKDRVSAKVNEMAERELLPKLETFIGDIVFQKTDTWGKPDGDPRTAPEFLRDCCRDYMAEMVDEKGDPRPKASGYSRDHWYKKSTRAEFLVDRFLDSTMVSVMSEAVKDTNESMAEAIQSTMAEHMTKLLTTFKVNVTKEKKK